MKTNIFSMVLAIFIAGTFITSCGENTKDSKDVQIDITETNQQMDQKAENLRAELNKDWENFKASSDEIIESREKEIKDLRGRIAEADKAQRETLTRELDDLEQKNKSLKERIAKRTENVKSDLREINEKSIEDHKAAQRQIKEDMDNVGKAIGDFFKRDSN